MHLQLLNSLRRGGSLGNRELLLGPVIRGSVSGYMTYCAATEQDGVLLSGLHGPMEGPSFAVEWNVLLLHSV